MRAVHPVGSKSFLVSSLIACLLLFPTSIKAEDSGRMMAYGMEVMLQGGKMVTRGGALITKGLELVEAGNATGNAGLVETGKGLITDGKDMMAKGEAVMKEGKKMTAGGGHEIKGRAGHKMMKNRPDAHEGDHSQPAAAPASKKECTNKGGMDHKAGVAEVKAGQPAAEAAHDHGGAMPEAAEKSPQE